MKSCSNEYTGCGLDDFDKKGERRPAKLSFSSISMINQGNFSKIIICKESYATNQRLYWYCS